MSYKLIYHNQIYSVVVFKRFCKALLFAPAKAGMQGTQFLKWSLTFQDFQFLELGHLKLGVLEPCNHKYRRLCKSL